MSKILILTNLKLCLQDLRVDGSETSASSVCWAMAELMKYPKLLEKAEEELDAVIGRERLVEEEDIDKLPYLRTVVYESMRLHSPPFAATRTAMKNAVVGESSGIQSRSMVEYLDQSQGTVL
ncbi:hypothetical protein Mapa_007240 [Marchantia paleacea]|nr:hypothetical protein Mapa_007240 [Marchantia paleacea]